MRNKRKWIIYTFLLTLLIAIFSACGGATIVKANEENVVRVGYWNMPGIQEGSEGEYKRGQSYEYLQKIAGYTGWTYEYIYGNFSELEKQLENGEIDLMANISYTDARAENILYGQHEQGKEAFYLYIKGNDSGISADDYSTINGKKIGVTEGLYQNELWEKWCNEQHITCENIEYPSVDKRQNALNAGEVDGTIGSMILNDTEQAKNWKTIVNFGESPYYFGVNKNRPDLLEQLNNAQSAILDENPYYNEELSTHYLGSGTVAQVRLKESEIQWLAAHEGIIKVGCLDDYLPVSDKKENGEMKGVIPDIFSTIEDNYNEYNVQFEQVVYRDYKKMIKDLKNGKIDLAAPIFGDYWNADQEGISLTNSFMSTTMLLLNSKAYSPDKIKVMGIDEQSPIQRVYAEIYYPQYELVMYPSMTEVARALVKGNIDAALSTACSYHINAIIDNNIKDLNRSTLPNSVEMAMGVSKQNPELMSFMNRGISSVGESVIYTSLAVNSNVEKKTTLIDFVSENPATTICVTGIIILALLVIILRLKKAIQRARTDSMTGLLNKIATHERIKDELTHGGVLFMIDIDNFKNVNDILGHTAGDEVICHFATSLQNIFRNGDIIGRFGGDEFIVFLSGSKCDEKIIRTKVDQMQRTLEQCKILAESDTVFCSVSVGVLIVEKDTTLTYADAFERADEALYEAKKKGKNNYVVKYVK